METMMKKFFVMLVSMALFVSVAVAPVWAAGGKNHGDVGQGETDQGDTGSGTGNASGDDAQDNQAP
jgi:opacity protein-like surface antigen